MEASSYHVTITLRDTPGRPVGFDRINKGPTRLSVGTIDARTGNFGSSVENIDMRHIIASVALQPGFAAVEINGEHYWDGGLVSNTPLQHVLDQPGKKRRSVLQVDLFAARGALPATLADATKREKAICFSSRTRLSAISELDRQVIAQAARRVIAKMPPALRSDPYVRARARARSESTVDVLQLIYRSKHYETQSKDYEFSRLSMHGHWDAGHADMAHTLRDPRWLAHDRHQTGVHVYDLTAGSPVAPPSA